MMSSRAWRAAVAILAVMVVLALAVAPAFAFNPAQTGGSTPAAMSASMQAGLSNFHPIAPGQADEWILQYAGSNDPATVELAMNPTDAVGFNVYTDAQWKSLPGQTGTVTPAGRGTVHTSTSGTTTTTLSNGDLFWLAQSSAPETYHIQVYSRSSSPASYAIDATGVGVNGFTAFGAPSAAGAAATAAPSGATTGAAATSAPASQAPRTLPVTGDDTTPLLVVVFAAGVLLFAAGRLARRRAG